MDAGTGILILRWHRLIDVYMSINLVRFVR